MSAQLEVKEINSRTFNNFVFPIQGLSRIFKARGNPDITTIVCGRVINNTKPLQIKYNIL
jgi:hypothetical protein